MVGRNSALGLVLLLLVDAVEEFLRRLGGAELFHFSPDLKAQTN